MVKRANEKKKKKKKKKERELKEGEIGGGLKGDDMQLKESVIGRMKKKAETKEEKIYRIKR